MDTPEQKETNNDWQIKEARRSRDRLLKTFDKYLSRYLPKGNPLQAISVGCGFAADAEPLTRLFPQASYTGVDLFKRTIDKAKCVNSDTQNRNITFKQGNLTDPEILKDQKFDLVIVRHPVILSVPESPREDTWFKILRNSINALRPKGVIFISTNTRLEKDAIERYLELFPEISFNATDRNFFGNPSERYGDTSIFTGQKSS